MKFKTILTVILVLFALAAVVVAIVKTANDNVAPTEQAEKSPVTQPASAPAEKIVVYYFHRNQRCRTCRTIEAFAHEVVQTDFASDLADDKMEWKVENYEQPENRHYIEKFQLASASVVIAKVQAGQVVQWKNLADVWKLVRNKPAFLNYVKSEIKNLQESK